MPAGAKRWNSVSLVPFWILEPQSKISEMGFLVPALRIPAQTWSIAFSIGAVEVGMDGDTTVTGATVTDLAVAVVLERVPTVGSGEPAQTW